MHKFLKCTDEKGKFDELGEDKGIRIVVDPKALMHVIGTKMDFVDDKPRSDFGLVAKFCNDNIISCDKSC